MVKDAGNAESDFQLCPEMAVGGSLILTSDPSAAEAVSPWIYQQILKTMHEGIWLIDAGGMTSYVNQRMAEILGYAVSEMIGRSFFEFMESKSKADAVSLFERRRNGISESHEFQFVTKLGEPRWTAMACSSFCDASGQFQGAVATVYDVSEKRRQELIHRENEQSLRMLLDKLPVTAWSVDQNYRILSSYGAGLRNLGLENNQLAGTSLIEFVNRLDSEIGNLLLSEHQKALAGQSVQFESYTLGRNIYNILEPIEGSGSEPIGMIGISVDLTERYESQKRLQESEARQRAILNTAIDAILSVDETGAIVSTNTASEKLFDYSQEELTGKFIHEVVVSDRNIFHRSESQGSIALLKQDEYQKPDIELTGKIKRTRDTGGAERSWFALRRDGSKIPVEISTGQIDGVPMKTLVIRDVSGIRALQRQLVSITEDQERRIGQELHDDIGQEMTGAAMLAEALISDLKRLDVGPEVIELAERIESRLVRSRGVVRKLARGLALELIDAQGLCHELEDLATSIRVLHRLDCFWSPADRFLNIDHETATQLLRIAQEAVNNAMKHSGASVIEITMSEKADFNCWELRISDNGKWFARPLSDGTHGGMGLRIMQYRANLIGGQIEFEFPAEGGTTVVCKFQEQVSHD